MYLVGAFEVEENKRDTSLGFRRLNAWSNETRIYQVWLRAYQVAGGTVDDERSQGEQGGDPDQTAGLDQNEFAPGGLSFVSYAEPEPKPIQSETWEAPLTPATLTQK